MENFNLLLNGLGTAFGFANIVSAVIGAILGLIVGAMPGIGAMAGVSILLPITFKMDPTTAIIMLAAIYYANMYGGSFTSILLNIPGETSAVMTALDGYALTQQKKAGKALFASNFSSFIGGLIGVVTLTMFGPALAEIGITFGPAELACLVLLAMVCIGWLLGSNPIKGLVATGLGIILSTIGTDVTLGQSRFTFGSVNLLSGVDFLPLVIGLFGFSQVLDMIMTANSGGFTVLKDKLTLKESLLTKAEYKQIMTPSLRAGVLGNFIGALPGAGATTAAFLCYIFEKKVSKNKANFGKGALEGVAASESANNSAAMGAFAPLLTLGLPGSGTTAILLGGLMMWGLRPGPLLFTENPDFVWGLIGSMYIGNIICLIISMLCIPFLVHAVRVPVPIMIPVITVICIVGTYSTSNSMFEVWLMLIAGVIGYLLETYKYPAVPLILGFILAPKLEMYVRQAFDISSGSFAIFVQKPIALTLLLITVGLCLTSLFMGFIGKFKKDRCRAGENPV